MFAMNMGIVILEESARKNLISHRKGGWKIRYYDE
jgi:hypothetical protein